MILNNNIKKLAVLGLSLFMIFIITACGSDKSEQPPLSEEEIENLFSEANQYEGRLVENMPIVVFQYIGKSDDVYSYQGYNDTHYEKNLIFSSNEKYDIKDGDYVLLSGRVEGFIEYETVMGVNMEAPLISNAKIEKKDSTIFNQAKNTREIGKSVEQYGIKVTLDKIEQAENSTRVYFTLENNSGDKMSIFTFDSYIKQGDTQYNESEISYEENTLKTEINDGIKNSGCLSFEKMDNIDGDLTVSLDVYSDDFEITLDPFVFNIK